MCLYISIYKSIYIFNKATEKAKQQLIQQDIHLLQRKLQRDLNRCRDLDRLNRRCGVTNLTSFFFVECSVVDSNLNNLHHDSSVDADAHVKDAYVGVRNMNGEGGIDEGEKKETKEQSTVNTWDKKAAFSATKDLSYGPDIEATLAPKFLLEEDEEEEYWTGIASPDRATPETLINSYPYPVGRTQPAYTVDAPRKSKDDIVHALLCMKYGC